MKDEAYSDEEKNELSRRHSRSGELSEKMEEELKSLVKDEVKLAREILLIKKELNRLHYKVKDYNKQQSTINAIVNSVVIGLLLVIAYRLFLGN
ncbi:MAG: hypothetical protein EAY75_09845 [Bacteroidetes bacterium]|nr:MAG: hypothetical protein EAY75_09845 [Bacteroidota bacterium]